MEVIPDSSHSSLQEGYSKQQQSRMVIIYHNESTFTFFIFSEVTEDVCEEQAEQGKHNVPTNSAVQEGYIKQQQSGQTCFYTG